MGPWLLAVARVALVVLGVGAFVLAYVLATAPFWPYLLGCEPWPYQ